MLKVLKRSAQRDSQRNPADSQHISTQSQHAISTQSQQRVHHISAIFGLGRVAREERIARLSRLRDFALFAMPPFQPPPQPQDMQDALMDDLGPLSNALASGEHKVFVQHLHRGERLPATFL